MKPTSISIHREDYGTDYNVELTYSNGTVLSYSIDVDDKDGLVDLIVLNGRSVETRPFSPFVEGEVRADNFKKEFLDLKHYYFFIKRKWFVFEWYDRKDFKKYFRTKKADEINPPA